MTDPVIYLDNAATTPVHPGVVSAMLPYYESWYGNPSSIHSYGRRARQGLDDARSVLARGLGCRAAEVVFTSGGTEADFSAVVGAYQAAVRSTVGPLHAVSTRIEHHAVLNAFEFLSHNGVEVTYVEPDAHGRIDVGSVLEGIRPETFLVSVMGVNNELGTIEPVADIAAACKRLNPSIVVHSDMVQALGVMSVSLQSTEIDLASFSAHKIHGPKGIGALYVRQGTAWLPVLPGGAQERNRRAGTENVAGAVGFGEALRLIQADFQSHLTQIRQVADRFVAGIRSLEGMTLLSPDEAAPSIVSVRFDGVRSDTLLMALDLDGVCASAGSACTAGSLEPSHVLRACGYSDEEVLSSIRFSFSAMNTPEEADLAAERVRSVVTRLRG